MYEKKKERNDVRMLCCRLVLLSQHFPYGLWSEALTADIFGDNLTGVAQWQSLRAAFR
jgi:hypothetical protein